MSRISIATQTNMPFYRKTRKELYRVKLRMQGASLEGIEAQAPQSTEFTPIAQESRYACTGGKDGVVWMVFQSHKCRVTSHHRPANPCQQAGNTGMELRPTRRTSRGKEGWHQAGICFWHEGGSLPQQHRPTTASRLKILEEAKPQELLFWSCIYSKLSPDSQAVGAVKSPMWNCTTTCLKPFTPVMLPPNAFLIILITF